MAHINQNGNFHTPLSPMRFQSQMGKEVRRRYKDGNNVVRLSLARVTKLNYKYNTVEVTTIQGKNSTVNNPNDNGRYSARLPIQFGGQTPDGKAFGTNTLATVGSLVLIGFLEGNKDNPIVLNIYGDADNQSMLTRTTFNSADESDESIQKELWQLFTLYPSMTYKNIDGNGNQEITFPGKTFFYSTDTDPDNAYVNDVDFDYDHLPSSHYANGDLIEPKSPNAPTMLYVHQGVYDSHKVTFFIKSDGTVRMGSRHADGEGVTFMELNPSGSFQITQQHDSTNPEDESNKFSTFVIEDDGTIVLQSQEHNLTIGNNGVFLDGGSLGGALDLSGNTIIQGIQGDITDIKQSTSSDGIMTTVTTSTGWHDINDKVDSKATTFVSPPQPPYDIGDIWKNGQTVYVCVVPRGIGGTFYMSDWTLSGDVTGQNTAYDTSNLGGTSSSTVLGNISNAQSTANSANTTAGNAQSVANSASSVANTAQGTANTAQTTANSKAAMFVSQPNPPYNKGDLWNNNGTVYVSNITRPATATFLSADWVLASDVTGQNTANDTNYVNGVSSNTVNTNISTAQGTANAAQTAAGNAQTTANSKARGFVTQPVPPYSLGDIYNNNGTVYICTTARSTGSYTASDWKLSGDVTANNTANDTSYVNGVSSSTVNTNISNANTAASNAQSIANSKAKTFTSQPAPPYNLGDIWNNGSTMYICTTARSTGSYSAGDWILTGDVTSQNTANDTSYVSGVSSSTVNTNISTAQGTANTAQSTANSKAKTFTSQPTPPYSKGDLWQNGGEVYVCITAKASGASYDGNDWYLAGDVTNLNTANDTAYVGGTPSATVLTNISNAQSTADSAASSASSANNTAVTAQSTANSKARTFTTTPTTPYSLGDMWNQNGQVYYCITPRSTGTMSASDWVIVADLTSLNTANDTTYVNGVSSSTVNTNISTAQSTADMAQSLATSKAKGFITQPVPPYSVGDVWDNGDTVYVCQVSRSTGSFTQADWKLAGDITGQNTSADTSNVGGVSSSTVNSNISNAQSTANSATTLASSKAKGFISQPVPPYSVGDIWNNGGTVYVCQTAKASGTTFAQADWKLAGDVTSNNTANDTTYVGGVSSNTVNSNISNAQSTANSANTAASNAQSTANSKAKGFVVQPFTPYSNGDVWNNNGTIYVCTTSRSTGSFTQSDWTLAGDVTANNTANDTSYVSGVSASTVNTNISTAQSTANSANTTASNAQSTANSANTAASNAQTTANSKAKTFTTTPTVPYSLGDIWKNGNTMYVCTTAKTSSGSYASADWTLVGDVTSQNTANDTTYVNGVSSSTVNTNISTAQSTANSANSAASAAQTSANNAQTTANSKAQGFVSQPVPPYNKGDVWNSNGIVYICTTAKASGTTFAQADWTKAGDITANNTANDTSYVNGVSSSTVNTNISTAQSTANSANTAASNAQSTANSANTAASNAQSTANSKAQTFTVQPAPPYSLGDIWKNGNAVYVCTTAKASGTTYASADWTLVGDVTANNTANDTSYVSGVSSSTVNSNISTAQSTANSANTAASNAQSTANSKAKTFTTTPAVPYSLGDIYKNGSAIYVCTTARSSGSYTATDFTLVGDVTANNTANDTSYVSGVSSSTVNTNISTAQSTANSANTAASNAQSTANSKAKTFTTTPTIPYSLGDIWKNGNAVYVCTTARSTGSYTASDWTLVGDVTANNTANDTTYVNGVSSSTVNTNISTAQSTANSANTAASNAQTSANTAQSTADSKSKTFTTTPTVPYSLGDIWKNGNAVYICTTGRSSGTYTASDWVLTSDVTANNTANDTTYVNGVSSSTVNTNISTAQSTANSASSAASAAQTSANSAQTTANSKAKTFTVTPTIPYSLGDVWKNGNAVYICTTGRSSGSYTASDWVLASDVTANNTANDTSYVNGVSSSTVNTNISTAQSTANSATTAASNAQSTANSANTAASNAQSTANSKAKTYTAQPAPPYNAGDIWKSTSAVYICTASRASGSYTASDWYLAGDVTANNTANDTSYVNGVSSSTVNTNISTAQTSANNAQTTANSKAKTFTAQPAPPYSVGDIWKSTSAVYICTTARSTGSYTASDWYLVGDVTSQNTAYDTTYVNGVSASTVTTNAANGASALTAINGLQIGGRNLLLNTGLTSDTSQWVAVTAPWKLDSSTYKGNGVFSITGATVRADLIPSSNFNYLPRSGETYTISGWFKTTSTQGSGIRMLWELPYWDTSGTYHMLGTYFEGQIGTDWTLVSITFTIPANFSHMDYRIDCFNSGDGTVYVSSIKLEKGTRPTDWSPAPEDLQAYTDGAVAGGRNYLKNTYGLNDLTDWAAVVGSSCVATLNVTNDADYGGVIDLNVTTNSATSGSNYIVITNNSLTLPGGKFVVGNTYTLSFLLKNALTMYVVFQDSNGQNPVAAASSYISPNTSWTKIVYTFTATATGSTPVFYLRANDTTHTGHVYVTQLMLEDGTHATGYVPAPEDTTGQIATLNSQMSTVLQNTTQDSIVNMVTSSNTYVNNLKAKADLGSLSGLATSDQVTSAQNAAQSYADKQIAGIDFSPYATTSLLTQTSSNLTAQFTSSGGVNMLMNSVGYSNTDFWTVTGSAITTQDPALDQFGSSSGFVLTGGVLSQNVIVTPGIAYTLSAIVNKGTAGTGYLKISDGIVTQTVSLSSGIAYSYQKLSINITPTSGVVTVSIYGDTASLGTTFTCVMLNVGSQAFTWQQHMGEVYNANINFDINGIRVSQTDSDGTLTGYTVMTPSKFAGYSDINGDGVIDSTTGSGDEIFRMDVDTFVMKSATINPVKIIPVTSGGYNGIAFIPSS